VTRAKHRTSQKHVLKNPSSRDKKRFSSKVLSGNLNGFLPSAPDSSDNRSSRFFKTCPTDEVEGGGGCWVWEISWALITEDHEKAELHGADTH